MDNLHPPGFLWPTKHNLLHHFMVLQNKGFAWDDSKWGHFHKTSSLPSKSPSLCKHPRSNATFKYHPAFTIKFARSYIQRWTLVCMNTPTPHTVCTGSVCYNFPLYSSLLMILFPFLFLSHTMTHIPFTFSQILHFSHTMTHSYFIFP